jgi:hypothetical protein
MPPNPRSESQPKAHSKDRGFVDIDTLRNADGIIAIISQRKSSGVYTIAVMKEFERDGQWERTQFISEHLFDSYTDMVQRAIERVRALREADSKKTA